MPLEQLTESLLAGLVDEAADVDGGPYGARWIAQAEAIDDEDMMTPPTDLSDVDDSVQPMNDGVSGAEQYARGQKCKVGETAKSTGCIPKLATAFNEYRQARPAGDAPFHALYESLKRNQPEMTTDDFRKALVSAHEAGTFRMSGWSGPPANIPHPEFAMELVKHQGKMQYLPVQLDAQGKAKRRDLVATYSELNALQKSLFGKIVNGFDQELSGKFDAWMREHGYDGAVLFDPEVSHTVPEEVVKLAPSSQYARLAEPLHYAAGQPCKPGETAAKTQCKPKLAGPMNRNPAQPPPLPLKQALQPMVDEFNRLQRIGDHASAKKVMDKMALAARAQGQNIWDITHRKPIHHPKPPEHWGSKEQPYWRPGRNPTVDNVITRNNPKTGEIEVLMIQRGPNGAEAGKWALPGGFHDTDAKKGEVWRPGKETAEEAALRELNEETGLDGSSLKGLMRKVGDYERPGRDPRDNEEAWAASSAFHVHLTPEQAKQMDAVKGMDDASAAKWVPVRDLKNYKLAFDHGNILKDAAKQSRRAGNIHRMKPPLKRVTARRVPAKTKAPSPLNEGREGDIIGGRVGRWLNKAGDWLDDHIPSLFEEGEAALHYGKPNPWQAFTTSTNTIGAYNTQTGAREYGEKAQQLLQGGGQSDDDEAVGEVVREEPKGGGLTLSGKALEVMKAGATPADIEKFMHELDDERLWFDDLLSVANAMGAWVPKGGTSPERVKDAIRDGFAAHRAQLKVDQMKQIAATLTPEEIKQAQADMRAQLARIDDISEQDRYDAEQLLESVFSTDTLAMADRRAMLESFAGVMAMAKAAVAVPVAAEHDVKELLGKGMDMLPRPLARAITGVFTAAFSTYLAGWKVAEEVGKETGASPERIKQVGSALAVLDILGAKAGLVAGATVGGIVGGAQGAAWGGSIGYMTPIFTLTYLGVQAGMHGPMKVYKAASRSVQQLIAKVRGSGPDPRMRRKGETRGQWKQRLAAMRDQKIKLLKAKTRPAPMTPEVAEALGRDKVAKLAKASKPFARTSAAFMYAVSELLVKHHQLTGKQVPGAARHGNLVDASLGQVIDLVDSVTSPTVSRSFGGVLNWLITHAGGLAGSLIKRLSA